MSAYLIAAHRTAVMPRGTGFARLEPHDLAAPLVAACLQSGGLDPDRIDELILSNALGAGGNPARILALASGLPERIAGLSIDRQCAGGLDAILLAAAMIEAGMAEAILTGGAESYSRRPLRFRPGPDGDPPQPYDQPPFTPWPDRDPDMTEAAAALADRLGISRDRQDVWAIESHAKARAAAPLATEIVPVAGNSTDGFTRDLTMRLAARAPVISGSITHANAAVAADGAALCLVVSERLAKAARRAVRIVTGSTLGGDPTEPGLAPVASIRATLARAGIGPANLGMAELMEAYAVQAIACVEAAGIDPDIVNLGGGALARGHPIGASGAILAVRLFHDLTKGRGLAAIAAAGGIGTALLLEA